MPEFRLINQGGGFPSLNNSYGLDYQPPEKRLDPTGGYTKLGHTNVLSKKITRKSYLAPKLKIITYELSINFSALVEHIYRKRYSKSKGNI